MMFNKNMTYPEALKKLFEATEGKPKEEADAIREEYKKVIPAIVKKELEGSRLTSYAI